MRLWTGTKWIDAAGPVAKPQAAARPAAKQPASTAPVFTSEEEFRKAVEREDTRLRDAHEDLDKRLTAVRAAEDELYTKKRTFEGERQAFEQERAEFERAKKATS